MKYLTEMADGLPDAVPSQDQQFAIAHRGDALAIYGSTVNQEWPPLLAARYQALVLHYDRVMRQFPKWVEFKRNAAVQVTPTEELDRASELSQKLRDVLSQGVEAGFVDPAFPEAVEKLEDVHSTNKENSLPGADANSDNLLSLDILESANNTVKQLAAKVLEKIEQASRYSAGHISKGANDAQEKRLQGLGKFLVNTVWFGFATGTATIFGSWLVTNFPQTFNWLRPVLEALKAIL
ncbi:hypothetical protein MNBD_ALPHA09-2262 [hydrothermal vent metagenome]|uniref:Uncharacterized protein n=1 Tax=hydrothermal vent metagenome TaxID=652676 RepID=A0A3B0T2W5_9ZZZZ